MVVTYLRVQTTTHTLFQLRISCFRIPFGNCIKCIHTIRIEIRRSIRHHIHILSIKWLRGKRQDNRHDVLDDRTFTSTWPNYAMHHNILNSTQNDDNTIDRLFDVTQTATDINSVKSFHCVCVCDVCTHAFQSKTVSIE